MSGEGRGCAGQLIRRRGRSWPNSSLWRQGVCRRALEIEKARAADCSKDLDRGRRERNSMRFCLLRRRGRLGPNSCVEIELLPPRPENFVFSDAG
jgi:hypothetical protein